MSNGDYLTLKCTHAVNNTLSNSLVPPKISPYKTFEPNKTARNQKSILRLSSVKSSQSVTFDYDGNFFHFYGQHFHWPDKVDTVVIKRLSGIKKPDSFFFGWDKPIQKWLKEQDRKQESPLTLKGLAPNCIKIAGGIIPRRGIQMVREAIKKAGYIYYKRDGWCVFIKSQ